MSNYKNLYTCLLETEELFELFSGMTGSWTEDKEKFIVAQKEMEDLAGFIDIFDNSHT